MFVKQLEKIANNYDFVLVSYFKEYSLTNVIKKIKLVINVYSNEISLTVIKNTSDKQLMDNPTIVSQTFAKDEDLFLFHLNKFVGEL